MSVVFSVGTSLGASVGATVKTSILASGSTFLARSPADPMLDGSDDTSAIEMSVSKEVDWLEQVKAMDANMTWAENAMPMAIMGHIMHSTHWQTYPSAGLLGPASLEHDECL